ncbi:MAG TPA: hypothetical protein VN669_05850 [Candidatus Acidoferrales bacterium]|jgi:hypothetical protein|nr:hypothetical protein [Candidatus Acidoferrales bacterium]
MTNMREEDRVLGRLGARILQPEELKLVTGGVHTNVCSFNPLTNTFDGECAPQ